MTNNQMLFNLCVYAIRMSDNPQSILPLVQSAREIIKEIEQEEAQKAEAPFLYDGITSAPG